MVVRIPTVQMAARATSCSMARMAGLLRTEGAMTTAAAAAHRLRTQQLSWATRRLYSTQFQQQAQTPPQFYPPPPPPPKKRRIRPSTIVFLLLGIASSVPSFLLFLKMRKPPSGALVRGSEEERAAQRMLRAIAETQLPLVQELQADPDWEEWDVGGRWQQPAEAAVVVTDSADVHGGELVDVADVAADVTPPVAPLVVAPPTPQQTRLTTGALGGFRGMGGCHRIFHNRSTGEVVSVLFLGPSLSGWPKTAHGGALATILDEALGRCAILALPARTGVTARLELQYRNPVSVPGWYVVWCTPDLPPPTPAGTADAEGQEPELRKLWCSATLERLDGVRCVEARGLFVVPRKYKLGRVEDKF